ncbi:MAG: hypothetical protein ABJQ37_19670 [Reichenbachiella sp.]|uniref:hypothetical protein n=1 Tax=Reichenbachiella sp. TaxID=2184521 RepID=UPI0032986917
MKKILNIAIVAFLALAIVACKDDLPAGEGIPQIYVTGATTALPTDVEEYSVGDAGSATWTVSDAAVASVAGNGSTANVTFLSPGDVRITATIGSESGYVDVRVSAVGVGVTVSYDSDGRLAKDSTGTVTFKFDAPLASTPLFGLDPKSTATLLDSLGTLSGSGDTYSAHVEGGSGDGTPNALLRNVVVTDAFGGDTADTISVALFTIDNVLANLMEQNVSPASGTVSWGSEISFELVFSEAMRPRMQDAGDTAVWLHFNYMQMVDGVNTAKVDSAVFTTEDMLTWTWSWTVPDSVNNAEMINFTGHDGRFLDLAGNPHVNNVMSTGAVFVDKAVPTFASRTFVELVEGSRSASNVNIGASFNDVGGVDMIHYLMHEVKDSIDAPTSLDDFSLGGAATAGSWDTDIELALDSSHYDMYWIATDIFGHVSEIDSSRVTIDGDGSGNGDIVITD